MRYGRLAAFAGMVVLSMGQAEAATFIRYTIDSEGYTIPVDSSGAQNGPTSYASYRINFAVPVDGSASDGLGDTVECNLNRCVTYGPLSGFRVDGSTSGFLFVGNGFTSPAGGSSISVQVSYTDTDAFGGLPLLLGSYAATGTIVRQEFAGYTGRSSVLLANAIRLDVSRATQLESLSISVLPEPASWAMLIVGLGSVGAIMRRRPAALIAATG